MGWHDYPMLFDTDADPEQQGDLAGDDRAVEADIRSPLVDALDALEASAVQFERLDLAR
jgi:hypothetical protein